MGLIKISASYLEPARKRIVALSLKTIITFVLIFSLILISPKFSHHPPTCSCDPWEDGRANGSDSELDMDDANCNLKSILSVLKRIEITKAEGEVKEQLVQIKGRKQDKAPMVKSYVVSQSSLS